jgi:hypothetical protein
VRVNDVSGCPSPGQPPFFCPAKPALLLHFPALGSIFFKKTKETLNIAKVSIVYKPIIVSVTAKFIGTVFFSGKAQVTIEIAPLLTPVCNRRLQNRA